MKTFTIAEVKYNDRLPSIYLGIVKDTQIFDKGRQQVQSLLKQLAARDISFSSFDGLSVCVYSNAEYAFDGLIQQIAGLDILSNGNIQDIQDQNWTENQYLSLKENGSLYWHSFNHMYDSAALNLDAPINIVQTLYDYNIAQSWIVDSLETAFQYLDRHDSDKLLQVRADLQRLKDQVWSIYED